MTIRAIVYTLLAFVMVLPSAVAQTSAPPKPDFAPMTYFVGLWNCKFLKNPDRALVGTTYSFAGATDPNGYWEILDLRDGRINITRDGPARRWTFIYLGNGGDYSVMTTPGWNGNTLTLKEVVTYGNAPSGEARFQKLSDKQYRADYFAITPSGQEMYETLCTRV